MDFNLELLIQKIEEFALANGFKSTDCYKFNSKSNSDTLLPKLYIDATIDYDKFLNGCVEKIYNLDLSIIIAASTTKPSIEIEKLSNKLLKQLFTDNDFFSNINLKQKIRLVTLKISNNIENYSTYGGCLGRLSIKIVNTEAL